MLQFVLFVKIIVIKQYIVRFQIKVGTAFAFIWSRQQVLFKTLNLIKETEMKKTAVVMMVIVGLTLSIGQQAFGHPHQGGKGMRGPHGGQGAGWQQLDEQTKEKLRTFQQNNKALRKEMAIKQAVKQAIMGSKNPDPKAAAKITGELFDLRQQMREKAVAAGVADHIGPMGPMGPGGPDGPRMGKRFGKGRFHGGPPRGRMFHQRMAGLDEETKSKIEKFRTENKDLKKKIVMKIAEKRALMNAEVINHDAVAAVAGELFDLHSAIREKAQAAGVEQHLRPFGPGRFGPHHPGMGPHHRGPGRS